MSILDQESFDIKALTKADEELLCAELRQLIIQTVSRTGGHLASNLGLVELTVALHKVFDTGQDRVVFDVGHQCYVHKILTGRMDKFNTLRSMGGIAGFPKPSESVHDAFIAGHASNSVSVALGMARARTLQKKGYSVISILGDGALTGGLSYEGLNDAGESGEPLIVILNDNGMSITPNVGGIAKYLSRQRLKPLYFRIKKAYHKFVDTIPGGRTLYRVSHRFKQRLKKMVLGFTMFEDMGFTYLGPVDGHDIGRLTYLLERAKELSRPVLLHITTTKGKGYKYSEERPEEFHGITPFNIKSGEAPAPVKTAFSERFGQILCELAGEDDRICAITAAMTQGTGLVEFSETFPDRFFDVGIAEGHAVSMAAGMAKQGMIPVFAVYSSFLQRSYDMLIHDVAILGVHVVLAVDRAGLVGEDGETHHGVFDVGYLRQIPGLTVYCPSNMAELKSMMGIAIYEKTGPVAIRYPRGGEGEFVDNYFHTQAAAIRKGTHVTIITYGVLINTALAAADLIGEKGFQVEVIKLSSITNIDNEAIIKSVLKTRNLVVIDDCVENGSVGQAIASLLAQNTISLNSLRLFNLGGGFIGHGLSKQLYSQAGISPENIAGYVIEELRNEKAAN